MCLFKPKQSENKKTTKKRKQNKIKIGLNIIVNLVCSSIRCCRKATSRIVGLEILDGLGNFVSDKVKLDRLIPYVRSIIVDGQKKITEEHPIVTAKAVEVMTNILGKVTHVPPKYARLFQDYIFKTILKLVEERKEEIVKIEVAKQLGKLAMISKSFLEYRDNHQQTSQDNPDDKQALRNVNK